MKYIFIMASALFFTNIANAEACLFDFNSNGICDDFNLKQNNEYRTGKITIKVDGTYSVNGTINEAMDGLIEGYFDGEIIVPIEFHSPSNPHINQLTFKWSNIDKNFILTKISYWFEPYREIERGSTVNYKDRLPIEFNVKRIKFYTYLSDFKNGNADYKTLDNNLTKSSIDQDINTIKDTIKKNKNYLFYRREPFTESNIKPIPKDLLYELSLNISPDNIETLNDYAYYIQRNGNHVDAIMLLEEIVRNTPARVVAKLNLADSYWATEQKQLAIEKYKEYISQMIISNKKSRIPQRVLQRTMQ